MYAVPDGGIVQVVFRGTVLNQEMLTVLHYVLDMPGGLTDGALALDAIDGQVGAVGGLHETYMLCLSQLYVFGRRRVQWINPDRFAYREYIPTFTTGQVAVDAQGPNMAVVLNKRSDIAGVHGRGQTHMPAVPTSFTTAGTVNAAGFLAYNDFGAQLAQDLVTLGSGTYHPIIFNRALPGEIVIINQSVTSEKVRTMHRRTVGLGT